MSISICLLFLLTSAFNAQAQQGIGINLNGGASYYTGTGNKESAILKPELDINKIWNGKKRVSFDTDLELGSVISKNKPQITFNSDISINYNLSYNSCTSSEEKYMIGLSLSPSILDNPIFFEEPFYSTTVGANTELKMGVIDIKISAAPIELLYKSGQYADHDPFCLDLNADVCVSIDRESNTPLVSVSGDNVNQDYLKDLETRIKDSR